MFLEQKRPEETLTQGGRNITRGNFRVFVWIPGIWPEQIIFQSVRRLANESPLRHCLKDRTLEASQFLNQWGNSIPHATGHCIYCESQKQNGLFTRGLVGTSKGQWENISIPAILSPRTISRQTFQTNYTNIDSFSSGMCFLEQTPLSQFNSFMVFLWQTLETFPFLPIFIFFKWNIFH